MFFVFPPSGGGALTDPSPSASILGGSAPPNHPEGEPEPGWGHADDVMTFALLMFGSGMARFQFSSSHCILWGSYGGLLQAHHDFQTLWGLHSCGFLWHAVALLSAAVPDPKLPCSIWRELPQVL